MIDIPYWSILVVYVVGVAIFVVWGFFYVFLMQRFGLFDAHGRFYTVFFLVFTVANLGLVVLAVFQIDWMQTFPFPPENFTLTPPTFGV